MINDNIIWSLISDNIIWSMINDNVIWSRKELGEIQDQIDYARQVEERLKGELKELNGNMMY